MSFSSTDDWFRSSDNNVSSAHFVINREGKIYQYVPTDGPEVAVNREAVSRN
jgi:N-acetyl-anhydromuramyl-L-alanine amidase AmpD